MRPKTLTISFRLDTNLADTLDERALADGLTRGMWVRKLVENELLRPFDPAQMEQQLSQLRHAQAKALYYCLVLIGKVAPDEAAELVRTKLLEQ